MTATVLMLLVIVGMVAGILLDRWLLAHQASKPHAFDFILREPTVGQRKFAMRSTQDK